MLLADHQVIVYGIAADPVSTAVVAALADGGAHCVLVGTDPAALDSAAALTRARGGFVETAVLDPADAAAVEDHLGALLRPTGDLDASVHLTPTAAAVGAVARRMARQARSVIVLIGSAVDDPVAVAVRREVAGRPGVRLVTLPADGVDGIARHIAVITHRTTT